MCPNPIHAIEFWNDRTITSAPPCGAVFTLSTTSTNALTAGDLVLLASPLSADNAAPLLFPEAPGYRTAHLGPQRRRATPPRAARVGVRLDPRLLRHVLPRRPRPE